MASKGPVLISALKNKASSQKDLNNEVAEAEVKRANSYGFVTKTYAETKEPLVNQRQTEDKVKTNWRQNRGQSKDKLETKKSVVLETRDKVGTKVETGMKTNQRQTEDKVETNWRQSLNVTLPEKSPKSFESLVGLQRKLLIIIFECTKESRSDITDPISVSFLYMKTGSTPNSVKKTLQRLEQAGILFREEFKNGRCGWTKYRILDSVYQKLINHETRDKLETKWVQTRDKVGTKVGTQPRTSSLEEEDILNINKSSSSGTSQITQLPSEWLSVDFSEFNEFSIPFGQNHVRQIFEQGRISSQELQDSIFHYSYDLRSTPGRKNAIQNHLGYFLNSLKNGPYAPPKGFRSKTEIAREQYLRSKKEEAERLENLKNELFETEYSIWWNKLSIEEQKKITIYDGMRGRVEAQRAFKNTIWPLKMKELSL